MNCFFIILNCFQLMSWITSIAADDGNKAVTLTLDEKIEEIKENYRFVYNTKAGFINTNSNLYISPGVDGLGVFSSDVIPMNQVIEVAPSLMIPSIAAIAINNIEERNILIDYVFPSPLPEYKLMVLGWGTVYNHCNDANIGWEIVKIPTEIVNQRSHHYADFCVMFFTIRDIQKDEELCWNYGKQYWDDRHSL